MDINNIKLFDKTELVQRLRQNGFGDAAVILQDKEVDGKKFLELTEFETFKWKLSPGQKRCLWNCVEGIKAKPSLLAVKQKPKLPNSQSFKEHPSNPSKTSDIGSFKGSLESILSTNARNPASRKPIVQPSLSQTDFTTQRSNNLAMSPVPPREVPLSIRKSPLPLPRQDHAVDYLSGYVSMHPPKEITEQSLDEYLTPREVKENHYEFAPVIINRNLSKIHSPVDKNVSPSLIPRRDASFENLSTKPVQPNQTAPTVSNKKGFNLVDHTRETPSSHAFVTSAKLDEGECNIYEPPPPLMSKVAPSKINTKGDKLLGLPNHIYMNTHPSLNTRPSIKDLGNFIIIEDKDSNQETPVFSKITNTLSNIFKKNKTRTPYENTTIINKVLEEETRNPVIRNRALPIIPTRDQNISDENQRAGYTASLFKKPFPVPRESAEPCKRNSYITVISSENTVEELHEEEAGGTYENVRDHKTNVKALGIRLFGYEIKEKDTQMNEHMRSPGVSTKIPQIICHKPPKTTLEISRMQSTEDEVDQIYENASTSSQGKIKALRPIPPQKPLTICEDEEETYENTSVSKLHTGVNEEHEIYENAEPSKKNRENSSVVKEIIPAGNDASYVTLIRSLNSEIQERRNKDYAESEEEDQTYENTNKTYDKDKSIKKEDIPRSFPSLGGADLSSRNGINSGAPPKDRRSQLHTDLACLLSMKLKERETQLQNKTGSLGNTSPINISEANSEDIAEIHSNSEDTFSDSDVEQEKSQIKKYHRSIIHRPLPSLPDVPTEVQPGLLKSLKKSPLLGCAIGCSPSSSLEDIVALSEQKSIRRAQLLNRNTPSNINRETEISKERLGSQIPRRRRYELYRLKSEECQENRPRSSQQNTTDECGSSENLVFNYKDDPFFRDTHREGARSLLRGLGHGAFLFRPGTIDFLVLTVVYRTKIHNLGFERIGNKIRLKAEEDSESPEFSSLGQFVDYFSRNPLTFHKRNHVLEVLLNPILPPALP